MAQKITILGKPVSPDCPFIAQLKSGDMLTYNGQPMPRAYFSAVQGYSQLRLYAKAKLIPFRGWQVGDIYTFFGWPKKKDHKVLLEWLDQLIETMKKGETIVGEVEE